MKHKLFDALETHFEAQKSSAIATLEVYFNNPAGIGEHPQIVEEMVKQINKVEHSEGCLKILNKHFADKREKPVPTPVQHISA